MQAEKKKTALACILFRISLSRPAGHFPSERWITFVRDKVDHFPSEFPNSGHEVKMLHAVHYKDPLYREVFGELIGTRYYRKCPDLMVDGYLYEYESYMRPWNKRKLSNMLTNGLRQSDRIIIDNRGGTGVRQIKRAIQSRLFVNATISEVWIYDGKNVIEVYKNTGVPEGPLQGGAP